MNETKPVLYSKTLWLNLVLALTAIFVPSVNQWVQTHPDAMALIFTGANALMRLVSKDKLSLN